MLFANGMFFQPITAALDIDHPAVVKQPIEDGRSDHGAPEELLPVGEALVGGDDRRALIIAIRDELEEEIGFPAVHGQVDGFIDDHEAGLIYAFPLLWVSLSLPIRVFMVVK